MAEGDGKAMDERSLPIALRLGKNGLSKGALDEIVRHLRKRSAVKVRFLKSFPFQKDRKTDAERIAFLAKAEVVFLKGYVFVLKRQRPSREGRSP